MQAGTPDDGGAKKYGTMGEGDAGGALASLQNEPMPAMPNADGGYPDEGIYPDPDASHQVRYHSNTMELFDGCEI